MNFDLSDNIDFSRIDANRLVDGNQSFNFGTDVGRFEGIAGELRIWSEVHATTSDIYIIEGDHQWRL